MLGGIKRMFGYGATRERPNPDPISAQIVIASQRNERASENARALLKDMLERSDGLRGEGNE